MENTFDVIIAGAGPVGLFLACELRLSGVSVLVLERDTSRSLTITSKPLGMRGFNNSSVEALYRRGLLYKIFDKSERPDFFEKSSKPQFAGHFAGNHLDLNKLDLSRWKYRLNGPSLLPGGTDLETICTVFTKHAEELGVKILTGEAIKDVKQNADEVTVMTSNMVYQAKWLVGCDGGRSAVRKSLGFEFVGTEPLFTGYSVLCDLEDPEKLSFGFHPTTNGMYIFVNGNDVRLIDFDNGAFHRSPDITQEHVQNVLRKASGTDVTIKKLHFATTWTDRAMQATTYRKGRVLLAGDSAHIHSPLGGQGLNAGIGDAINLGWKLAATIKGTAPECLIDTYEKERHPIGAWVLEWTRAQVMTLKPDLFGQASRKVIQDLIATVDGTNYFIDRVWGLSQRYDLENEHPLVGASVPDFELVDGSRFGPNMINGKAFIIDFENDSSLLKLAQEWGDRVDYFGAKATDTLGLKALIVRPDGIVAWVAENEINSEKAQATLIKWLGNKMEINND